MKNLVPFFLLILALQAFGQRDLPHYAAPFERSILPISLPAPGGNVHFAPPPVPVRSMAEWEELDAVVITWQTDTESYKKALADIVAAAQTECKVIICCADEDYLQKCQTYLKAQNIKLDLNLEFNVMENNSIWVRDFGPNCVYANNVDSLLLIDWRYNRITRPQDDAMSIPLAKSLNISLYATQEAPEDLVHTGGNFMSDGLGTAFSSKLILDENKKSNAYGVSEKNETQIDNIMEQYMGIKRYIKMPVLPYDGIHHIDMHMKLLDEETLLVGQYPQGKSDGPQIEANIQYVLSNYKSVFGTPYKVVRIPMPSFLGTYPPYSGDPYLYPTYANALFANKTVIMPSYGNVLDQAAIDTFKAHMPGYRVVPVRCNSLVRAGGAVHCITKEIGAKDPLQIVHQPLDCQDVTLNGYTVNALLRHKSDIADAKVWYSVDAGQTWQFVTMHTMQGNALYNYTSEIPKQAMGSKVLYYVEAESFSGKKAVRPITAPTGYWQFCVKTESAVADIQAAKLMEIYPNPASDITAVPVWSHAKTNAQLALHDAFGRCLQILHDGELAAGENHYFTDASQLAAGTYFVSLRTQGQWMMKKLIVK